jgi:hypothetical protein
MAIPADITEQHDRMLGELADLAMDLARDLAAKAKASDNLEDAERFARGFERMARCVRLTIGLQRRLHADARRDWSAERTTAVELRKAQVRASVRASIRETYANPFAMPRIERERDLDERLMEEALEQAFLDAPLDVVIARIREKLGLPEPNASPSSWREGPGTDAAPAPS